jgi:sarcosine oxidase subunit delta
VRPARDENEFHCGGTTGTSPGRRWTAATRPGVRYLFFRDNPQGRTRRALAHTYGCGEWFNVQRDTVSTR